MRALYPNEFVCTDKFAGVYLGWFRLPPWHKTPKEDIYKALDIKWDVGDPTLKTVDAGEPLRTKASEDIAMHDEIIRAYADPKNKGSIRAVARVTGFDRDTIGKHIRNHENKGCSCFVDSYGMANA
jgi:hypothetical protein